MEIERRYCPSIMVNTKHDAASYESCSYKRDISDGNVLYAGFWKAQQNVNWKAQVQRFEMNLLTELASLQHDLRNQQYTFSPETHFLMRTRGRVRPITSEHIRDRVSKHALCDEVLAPAVAKMLIHDNGASRVGKGISFTRARLLAHLQRYYLKHGNDGYILLMDFTKYYDNLLHSIIYEMFEPLVDDPIAWYLFKLCISRSTLDVSYMTDEEYACCLDTLFNYVDYQLKDQALFTGEKYMEKHLNIGDQVAQIVGITYPTRFDTYIKIVRSVKGYSRYMDDSYAIDQSKMFLEDLLGGAIEQAATLGITLNRKKTRIVKLSDYWRFLKIQYSLTETGRVVKKINPERLTVMRRRMKLVYKKMTPLAFTNWYNSWYQNHYRLMSKKQRENMNTLFNELLEEIK